MSLHHCGGDHQGQVLATARCEYETAVFADLSAYVATLDQPPTCAHLHDLWAHANTIHGDGTEAARWARQVLDLGWRPTVGAEPRSRPGQTAGGEG